MFRWPLSVVSEAKERSTTLSERNNQSEIVINSINNIPCLDCGAPEGHSTRTLAFDEENRLYVSVGSVSNIDLNSARSRIRRFDLTDFPVGGLVFNEGEVFADGLRNEVALEFDRHGVLWGVENGADNLYREDLGGDIHNDNPAEEVNKFYEPENNTHYGYPFCFSEHSLPSKVSEGRGSQWAWPLFLNKPIEFENHFLDGVIATDEFCKTQIVPPVASLTAHSAPLGMTFAKNLIDKPSDCVGGFPASFQDNLFIAYHGSWNREIPTGKKVVMLEIDEEGNVANPEPIDIFCSEGKHVNFDSGLRPVDIEFDRCGRLLVTSDGSGNQGVGSTLFAITYFGPEDISVSEFDTLKCNESKINIPFVIFVAAALGGVVVLALLLVKVSNKFMFVNPKNQSKPKIATL